MGQGHRPLMDGQMGRSETWRPGPGHGEHLSRPPSTVPVAGQLAHSPRGPHSALCTGPAWSPELIRSEAQGR